MSGWVEWKRCSTGEVGNDVYPLAVLDVEGSMLIMDGLFRYYEKQGFVRLGDVVDGTDWPATVLERRVQL